MSGEILTPKTEEEAAAIVASSITAGRRLRLSGTGTKSSGFAGESSALSSLGLTGILSYNPAELVITARAGTPMTEINAALNEHNQMLAFEPGNWGVALGAPGTQTIGGIAATNQSGSRRFVSGAARDSLLGVRFVNGKGEIIKNGGRVMKNVTGLDLVKLLAGSWGTLGFLTEVSFKVLPRPVMEKTLAVQFSDDTAGTQLLASAMATSADVTGAAHLPAKAVKVLAEAKLDEKPTSLLRFEGFEASIDERIKRVKPYLSTQSGLSVIAHEHSRRLWADMNDLALFSGTADRHLWKLSLPPSKGIETALALSENSETNWFADWQGGLVWVECAPEQSGVQSLAAQSGAHATLMRKASGTGGQSAMFQPLPPAAAALSEAVRSSLDPHNVFLSPMNFASSNALAA
ncbi:MAG: FAD-binding protein [Pseudomonadota bacterium]